MPSSRRIAIAYPNFGVIIGIYLILEENIISNFYDHDGVIVAFGGSELLNIVVVIPKSLFSDHAPLDMPYGDALNTISFGLFPCFSVFFIYEI